jgi:hypothetical protein
MRSGKCVRREASTSSNGDFEFTADAEHRVIAGLHDDAVMFEERVGDRGQSQSSLVTAGRHRLLSGIAGGDDQRALNAPREQHVQWRTRQHHPERFI